LSFKSGSENLAGINVKSTRLGNLSEAKPVKVNFAITKEDKELAKL